MIFANRDLPHPCNIFAIFLIPEIPYYVLKVLQHRLSNNNVKFESQILRRSTWEMI